MGCVLYELCTLKHPFTGANQAGLILRIVRGKYEPIPSFYSKDLADVVAKCLQRDTRKRPSIHELLEMDCVKKKAKTLNIVIPSKDEVVASIENQKNEMMTTFQRKKTEVEPKVKSARDTPTSSKTKSTKESSLSKKGKDSNLVKEDSAKQKKLSSNKTEIKSEHQIKIEELENKVQERKKKHEDFLKKRESTKSTPKDNIAASYLRDPEINKVKSEGNKKSKEKSKDGDLSDGKYAGRSPLAVDVPKTSNNQRVVRPGIKHADSDLDIKKPKNTPQSSQEVRNKTSVDVSKNLRNRAGQQTTGLSRQAQLAARKGSDLYKKKAVQEQKHNAYKKEVEDVYNLPDFPKEGSSSSDEDKYNTMNKPAMQLVAELRAKQDSKVKKHYSAMHEKNKSINDLNNQKMVLPKEGKGSYNAEERKVSQKGFLEAKSNFAHAKSNNSQQNLNDDDFDDLLRAEKKGSQGGQQKLSSADIDDLLNGKKKDTKQAKVGDDEFDSLLNTKPSGAKKSNLGSAASYPVEMQWKINNDSLAADEEEKEEAEDADDLSLDDSVEDVDAAFNFTDTEFDANNRDDYDVETEYLRGAKTSLHAIQEVDEESEQTIQKRKCEYEIKGLEKRIKEIESEQKSKWEH